MLATNFKKSKMSRTQRVNANEYKVICKVGIALEECAGPASLSHGCEARTQLPRCLWPVPSLPSSLPQFRLIQLGLGAQQKLASVQGLLGLGLVTFASPKTLSYVTTGNCNWNACRNLSSQSEM